jgi:hypothetical protein
VAHPPLLLFGNLATYLRPMVLRARLATGLPFRSYQGDALRPLLYLSAH